MRILIPAYWNAPLGGLHSHLLGQVRAILGAGHTCTVMCRPGQIADRLRALGADVHETDFEDQAADATSAAGRGFDIVHAHPGAAREIGVQVARALGVPFLLTLHGTRLDSLPSYANDVDVVVAVSSAIRDFVVAAGAFPAERTVVIPNGVDTTVFNPHGPAGAPARDAGERRIALVTRFDRDKRFVADVVKETWERMLDGDAGRWTWLVAGQGTVGSMHPDLEKLAERLSASSARPVVQFLGWLDDDALAALYRSVDITVAAGRAVLESMACGTPAIALGSRGYVGLIDRERLLAGAYGNFGGLGEQERSYRPLSLFDDLRRALDDDTERHRLAALSRVAAGLFAQDRIDAHLLALYEAVAHLRPHREISAEPLQTPVHARVSTLQERALDDRRRAARAERELERARAQSAEARRALSRARSGRWWRAGEALRAARRRPALMLRLPYDLVRALRRGKVSGPRRAP